MLKPSMLILKLLINTKAVDEANKKLVEHATVINENTKAINDNVDSINTNAESIAKNTGYIKEIVEKNIELGEAVKENKENILSSNWLN